MRQEDGDPTHIDEPRLFRSKSHRLVDILVLTTITLFAASGTEHCAKTNRGPSVVFVASRSVLSEPPASRLPIELPRIQESTIQQWVLMP